MPKLKITIEGNTTERELSEGSLVAGRQPDLDIPLPVKAASREHFRVGKLKDGGWGIQDLGSTNGTLVNGERIQVSRLKHRDVIQVGPDCEIVFLDPKPVVLKSRAQRLKEEQEEAARQRAAERKAERERKAAEAAADPVAADAGTDADAAAEVTAEITQTEEIEEVPVDAIEIDSEERLVELLKDRDAFDQLLGSDKMVTFGPYTILRRLSEGGMGVVFKAHHRKQKIDVALKLLRTEMVDAQNIARFKQEAWAISAFDHPNIVKVRDLSQRGGMYYIAMDYIHGEDLLAVGFKRALTFWQVMETIDKLADVLHLVHARNIWHRDIKPQNVLMDRSGEIKLIDFGIATVEREQDDATKTADGLIMGTPAFLSPEQAARGKMGAIDGRADLYSVGAVMYYLLTGRRPFTGRSPLEILRSNMKDPPPHPHTVDPIIPAGLVEICLKLLEKNPDDRYQSAEQLQAALAAWRKSKDGRLEAERHRKILKLRARKAKLNRP